MSLKIKIGLILTIVLSAAVSISTFGQMKKIVEKEGLGIYFLFYGEGNGIEDNGVVIYLKNENNYSVKYSFQLIFRAEQGEQTRDVDGSLKAGEGKTGSNDGLFFIPFADKRSVIEVGVKKIRVDKLID